MKFEIIFNEIKDELHFEGDLNIKSFKVEGSSVIEVCSKLILLIAQITERHKEEKIKQLNKIKNDDDIPF